MSTTTNQVPFAAYTVTIPANRAFYGGILSNAEAEAVAGCLCDMLLNQFEGINVEFDFSERRAMTPVTGPDNNQSAMISRWLDDHWTEAELNADYSDCGDDNEDKED